MELKLITTADNRFPVKGIFIRGENPVDWSNVAQNLGISCYRLRFYPIPARKANQVWGCFVNWSAEVDVRQLKKYEYALQADENLFIAEKTTLFPPFSESELEILLNNKKHAFHPEFGLVELEDEIVWENLVEVPRQDEVEVNQVEDGFMLSSKIKAYHILTSEEENPLEEFEKSVVPEKKKFENKPLSVFEKLKLSVYRLFLKQSKEKNGDKKTELTRTGEKLNRLLGNKNLEDSKVKEDFDKLEERSAKEVDKLMDLLSKDPEEALKYALPLDETGAPRGSNYASFTMSKRWDTGYGNFGSGGGTAIMASSDYNRLRNKYTNIAQTFIKEGDYRKAAFIYMKLLQDNRLAASTLEKGGLYREAAELYLSKLKSKEKAAACYEKGNYFNEAIELYKELNQYEKAGDLAVKLGRKKDAYAYYEVVTEEMLKGKQYVNASIVLIRKMNRYERGQEVLLEGWKNQKQSFNCLNNYLNNIEDGQEKLKQMRKIQQEDVNKSNYNVYLKAIALEYPKQNEASEEVRELAYEVISAYAFEDEQVLDQLRNFNKKDPEIMKDVIRYKNGK